MLRYINECIIIIIIIIIIITFAPGAPNAYKCHTCSLDGVTLPINHRQHVSADGSLTVQDVDRGLDAGQYMCDARNAQEQGMRRAVFVHVMGQCAKHNARNSLILHTKRNEYYQAL